MLTHRWVFWGVMVLSGCAAARQYTLEIDARDPGATRLCSVESGGTRNIDRPCPQFANDTLDSPGTLNVVVTHAPDSATYRLRLQQTILGATGQDAATIVATVLQRLAGFANSYMSSASLPDPSADAAKRKDALTEFGRQLLAAGKEEAATAAKREVEKMVGALPPTAARFNASQLSYGAFLDKDHPDQPPHALPPNANEPGLLHQRSTPYPPPRLVKLEKQDLIALTAETPPHQGADPELWLARLTQATCSLASFGDAPYRDAKPLPEYFKNNTPTKQALAVALQIEHTSIDDLLKIEDDIGRTTLITRLQDLRKSARRKIAARLNGQPTEALKADEELVVALYDGDRAYRDATNCIANVDYIASLASAKPADTDLKKLAAALTAERAGLVEFQQSTAKYHDVFYEVIDAVVERVVVSLTLGVYSGGDMHFSSMSLQPGQLQVGVTRAQGSETPTSVVDYTINVETNPRYAVSIGPVLSFCRSCYRHITEQIESDTMTGRRELVLATEPSDYATGVLLHVALLNHGSLSVGLALGYPISEVQDRTQAVLLGASVRHRIGVALSAGVSLFNGIHLKPAYGGRDAQSGTTINTSLPGFTGLTAESVVDQGHEAAFFISVGVTSDLFQRLN